MSAGTAVVGATNEEIVAIRIALEPLAVARAAARGLTPVHREQIWTLLLNQSLCVHNQVAFWSKEMEFTRLLCLPGSKATLARSLWNAVVLSPTPRNVECVVWLRGQEDLFAAVVAGDQVLARQLSLTQLSWRFAHDEG